MIRFLALVFILSSCSTEPENTRSEESNPNRKNLNFTGDNPFEDKKSHLFALKTISKENCNRVGENDNNIIEAIWAKRDGLAEKLKFSDLKIKTKADVVAAVGNKKTIIAYDDTDKACHVTIPFPESKSEEFSDDEMDVISDDAITDDEVLEDESSDMIYE